MRLHEYQAKSILAKYGLVVPLGNVAFTSKEAEKIYEQLGGPCVVKAQVHAGGRGKAGGVRLVYSPKETKDVTDDLIGHRLVTPQTGSAGAPIDCVLVEEQLDIDREIYLSIVVDGKAQAPVILASRAGGMDIEQIAEDSPELILREVVDPLLGFQAFQGRRIAAAMDIPKDVVAPLTHQILCLYNAFIANNCSLAEINPLVITKDSRVISLDAKLELDDDAMFRHKDMESLRDWSQDDPLEAQAGKSSIAYVKLEGDVGCLVNGAGLAMATMDIIKSAGCEPANFLDVGGGASSEKVADAVGIVLQDPQVTRILVNVFGGIARCDEIAKGIVKGVHESGKKMPIVVRLLGTNVEEGKQILDESGLDIHFTRELVDSAKILGEITQ